MPKLNHVDCRGVEISDEYFAYCEPGRVTLELTADKDASPPNLRFIGSTSDDYAKTLQWFRFRKKDAPIVQSFEISLSTEDLAMYEFDVEKSIEWMNATRDYVQEYLRLLQKEGHLNLQCLFPRVSKNDPFYHVYVTDNGKVDSVWEFIAIDGVLQPHPNWTYDLPHHSIPLGASMYAAESERWYSRVSLSPGN